VISSDRRGEPGEIESVLAAHPMTDRERGVVPPADELEATLVEIYSRVLQTSPVSVLDTFVQLGGHSMLAFQLLDECKEHLHATPDVTRLITGTLRDVAASIRGTDEPGTVRHGD
jgi:hypothetical protein